MLMNYFAHFERARVSEREKKRERERERESGGRGNEETRESGKKERGRYIKREWRKRKM